MEQIMNKQIYEVVPDHLVVGVRHPVDARLVKIQPTGGVVARGTLLAKIEGEDTHVILGSTLANGKQTSVCCIVATDLDTTDVTEPVYAEVYITGEFNQNKLIYADGYELSESDIDFLQMRGIFLTSVQL